MWLQVVRRLVVVLAVVTGFVVVPVTGARAAGLQEVTGFGSNPGNLRMFRYVPDGLEPGRPLVVALHGCTQSAAAYDVEPGWVEVAERMRFALLLPQQQSSNNLNACFNWFETGDTTRGSGEALSIKQMVDRMRSDFATASSFVTGLSAGGAMTSVMLATYPEVFAAGAVVAGLPYRCATSVAQAFSCMSPGTNLTPQQWGDKVRAASSGPWPTISLWHGTADSTVAYSNLNELVEQWTDVHGTDQTADVSDTVGSYPHKVYRDSAGVSVVETYSITGMNHGQPIDPGTCGTTAPYILDVNICAAEHIARFWGLDDAPTSPGTLTFPSIDSQDGYVKAQSDGSAPVVGTLANLAVGHGTDGKQNRAVLSFDTSTIPDDATITRAWLTVTAASGVGDPWAGSNQLLIDAQSGCFNACTTEPADWTAPPTTPAVASLPPFTTGPATSSDFSPTTINRTGPTQLKLRFAQSPTTTAYRFLSPGAQATLHVTYEA